MVPLLCLILFAIIDYGRALNTEQIMVDLTRQGSNMASRGTALATAASTVALNSAPLTVSSLGLVIVSSVARVNNVDTVTGQAGTGGISVASKIGTLNGKATVPAAVDDIFSKNSGQTVYITEIYYPLTAITPLAAMWGQLLPTTLYQVAYF